MTVGTTSGSWSIVSRVNATFSAQLDVWGGCIDMIDMCLSILGIYLVHCEWCRLGWVRSQFRLVKIALNDDLDVVTLSGSDGPAIGTM